MVNSGFNKDASKTVILIHGFTDNRTVHLDEVLIPGRIVVKFKLVYNFVFTNMLHFYTAYLNSGLKYNFIAVDWGRLSGNAPFQNSAEEFLIYTQVVSTSIPIVVNRTEKFIEFLGVDPSTIHIIGHSLGAHTAGQIGNIYKSITNNFVSRITGLDPAGPLFFIPLPFPKINKNDANFVDIIHTNMGESGDVLTNGHIDVIVNGGVSQPGCNLTTDGNYLYIHTFLLVVISLFLIKFLFIQSAQMLAVINLHPSCMLRHYLKTCQLVNV